MEGRPVIDIAALPACPFPRPPIDPPEEYQRLRRDEPVSRVNYFGTPTWLLARHDDVRKVLTDPRVSADESRPGFPSLPIIAQLPDEFRTFLRMDSPDHTAWRRQLGRHFTTRRIEALRPRLAELVESTFDAFLARPERPVDLVEHLALPIPSTVIAWLLGVPAEDQDYFNRLSVEMVEVSAATDPDEVRSYQTKYEELGAYLLSLIQARYMAEDPPDDLLADLARMAKEDAVSPIRLVSTALVVLFAGHDTTTSMISLGTLTLLQHPDQLEELQADPRLVPGAVEELLRYLTNVHLLLARVAVEDIEVAGTTIRAGEGILALNFSANRDEAHYDNPDVLDIHRRARDHLAFGFGPHTCIGAALGRAELQIVFEALLRRVPTLELAVPFDELDFRSQSVINSVRTLPVTW